MKLLVGIGNNFVFLLRVIFISEVEVWKNIDPSPQRAVAMNGTFKLKILEIRQTQTCEVDIVKYSE